MIGDRLLHFALALIAVLLVARIGYVFAINPQWEFGVHRFMPLRFDTLLFGVVAAVIVRDHKNVYERLTSPRSMKLASLSLVIFSALFAGQYYRGTIDTADWLHTVGLTIIGFIVMVIVLCALRYPSCPPRYAFLQRPVLLVSSISYSLYLVHLFIFQAMAKIPAYRPLVYAVSVVLAVVAAWLSFTLFERRVVGVRNTMQSRWFGASPRRQFITAEIEKQP